MEVARIDPVRLLRRHQSGDRVDLGEEDWRENDFAVGRLLRKPPERLWVITEADRSVTTVRRPDEY